MGNKDTYIMLAGLFASIGLLYTMLNPVWLGDAMSYLRSGGEQVAPNSSILRDIALGIAGIIGLILTGWRSASIDRQSKAQLQQSKAQLQQARAQRQLVKEQTKQTQLAIQGSITDRIIKATEQLGSSELTVRTGAIYTLWRTAKDSEEQGDKLAILDMLCAFIRTASHGANDTVRSDVQIALTHVCRKRDELSLRKTYSIDLSETNLAGACLFEANLEKANLYGVNLSNADLSGVALSKANIFEANFEKAYLFGANLSDAYLSKVNFKEAKLSGADLSRASLLMANLEWANLEGANLTEADLTDVTLVKANLTKTNLRNIRIESIYNVTGAIFSSEEQLDALKLTPEQRTLVIIEPL